jgi:hypothetical protein
MNFSSLVLMEREIETNHLVREMGSYEVGDGAQYIRKFYFDGSLVNVTFETLRDVEEWEYSAIFDLFDEKSFRDNGFKIEQIDDEYNPMWLVTMDYIEDHITMQDKVNKLCGIIYENMDKVFKDIEGHEEEYK